MNSYAQAMETDWRQRLKRLIVETAGLSMKSVSLKAGLSASGLHDIANVMEKAANTGANFLAEVWTKLLVTLSGSEHDSRKCG